jgi:hypothetical protein
VEPAAVVGFQGEGVEPVVILVADLAPRYLAMSAVDLAARAVGNLASLAVADRDARQPIATICGLGSIDLRR